MVKSYYSRAICASAAIYGLAILPASAQTASSSATEAATQTTGPCSAKLGNDVVGNGRKLGVTKAQAKFSCGAQALDLGEADEIAAGYFAASDRYAVLVRKGREQRLIVLRRPAAAGASSSAKRFAAYEVDERPLTGISIFNMGAFMKSGGISITYIGGP